VVLSGVFSNSWVAALDPKIRSLASREVSVPLRVFNACRTGYSVPRIPLRRFDVLEVFRRASSPLSSESGSSSPRLRTLFRDPNQVPPCFLRRKTVAGIAGLLP